MVESGRVKVGVGLTRSRSWFSGRWGAGEGWWGDKVLVVGQV